MTGDFWRVIPGRYPFRNAEVRVQLRRKTRVGSVLLDELSVWVDDTAPHVAVDRAKSAIEKRRAHEGSVRAILGDSPTE